MPHRGLKYSARKMLECSPEELKQMLSGEFTLVFDDGELEVNCRSTYFSSFAWEFHRLWPETPMLKKHHITDFVGAGSLTSRTHITLLENVAWSAFDAYKGIKGGPDTDMLARKIYQITNKLYNGLILEIEEHVVTLDILDFIEIIEHPEVKEAMADPQPTQEYIEKSYRVLTKALKNTPELEHNNLSKAVRAGLVREGQTLQSLGPRGFITDIDSNYFKFPILRGFTQGMRGFGDALVESRSAAKSIVTNQSLLQQAEYFARRLQILCQVVETLHEGDCGSDHYLKWRIRDKDLDEEGKVVRPSDLDTFHGKYYKDEITGELKMISPKDKHLIGKILNIRSPIAGCNHPNPNGICQVCFGELGLNVPKRTNLGHLCASTMTQQSNQNLLSTKHYLDGASLTAAIKIPPEYTNYLSVSNSGKGYLLKNTLKDKEVYIILPPQYVPGLVDIANVEDVNELGLSHVSEIPAFGIRIIDKNGVENSLQLNVAVDRRKASLTHAALSHIRKMGWSFDEKGNYIVSMKGWDYSRALMKLPQRQYNMSDHAQAISVAIESNQEKLKERDGSHSPEDILIELSDLVNSKLKVNIALLEVILLASLIKSKQQDNYYIPKNYSTKELTVARDTIANRSLSGTCAYDAMAQRLMHPSSLFHDHRPELLMDVFIKPEETINDPYRFSKIFDDDLIAR